ncbi:DUF6389 family protein [Achromobacter pestifer]|uniref:Uncharacterized protein n=1 Tax=Achromobacter pestifer TaxID=1353889 RepID=A0A6S6YYN5_9BURK|nr:DUF6389 family protein [Achromobacter pestifer]CAB3642324.1 hypothetical protein LMG3431_02214 [Achromobacter pestifer]
MNLQEYQVALRRVLDGHSVKAQESLTALIKALPEKAREIRVGIFPDQDGEGTFSVVISLEGPDLYVLNKAVDAHRTLFDVRHTSTGVSPAVPMFGAASAGFVVQDAIVDTAADWVEALWESVGRGQSPLPGLIYGDDDAGTTMPRALPT